MTLSGLFLLGFLAPSPLFDLLCTPCHGPAGRGDGPAALVYTPRPADLTGPLRMGREPGAVAHTLRFGIPGTGMPAFGTLTEKDLAALVDEVLDLPAENAPPDRLWAPEALNPSRPPPPGPPILQTGAADQCGRCHPAIQAQWATSRHAHAWGPGLLGQAVGRAPAWVEGCAACHGPVRGVRDEGVSCAACHLRDHQKVGAGPGDERAPGLRAVGHPRFKRADFCLPCHNLPPGPDNRPLLDTWREWAASPYLPAGIQCQHCHLPQGDHRFAGAHDADAVRRAVRLSTTLSVAPLRLEVRVQNVGAGHHFPTTPTPRAVVRVRQFAAGQPLPDTQRSWALGRTLKAGPQGLEELADTRIPAGRSRAITYDLPRNPAADAVEVELSFFPDWYYAGLFRTALANPQTPPAARAEYERALQEAETSGFLVTAQRLPLP